MSIIVGDTPKRGQPVLFLDFDDVVNVAPSRCGDSSDNFCSSIDMSVDSYDFDIERRLDIDTNSGKVNIGIRVSSNMIGDIESLLDDGVALLWLTSWKSHTVLLNDVLGINDDSNRTVGYVDWRYRGFSDSGEFGKVEYLRRLYRSDIYTNDDGDRVLDETNRFVSIDNVYLEPLIAGSFDAENALQNVDNRLRTRFDSGIELDGFYGSIPGLSKVNDDIAVGYGFTGVCDTCKTFPFMTITPDYRIGATRKQLHIARSFLLEK